MVTTSKLSINEEQNVHLDKHGAEKSTVLNHPVGLFVLFFTEMWERFSYYGMRALLTLFLVSEIAKGGWEWSNADALKLYGWYTGLVYLTPIIGGMIADRLLGFKKAVLVGALLMTLGHAAMALEGIATYFFYLGLLLLILGNGLFKPNISSMVGQLYPARSDKKDAAYTIFYMGINAGSFLGIMMCGYVGERVGWHWGFGLAGIFMFFGMLQFLFAKKVFGNIGDEAEAKVVREKVEEVRELPKKAINQRLVVIGIFSLFTVFFWMAFEQAGGSMTIFAKDYTLRNLEGSSGTLFKWSDAALTIFPLMVVTWVLYGLARKLINKYPLTILFTALSFLIIWVLAIWKVEKEFSATSTEVPASWFGILNSFFIITCAPILSKIWETRYNPSGPIKFAIGLILVGTGFAALAYGGSSIEKGATVAQVSMVWLIIAYLFHSLGELCVSPVGLSYVSKLAPAKLVGMMFGIWFLANFVANLLAGLTGSLIDSITQAHSISYFFMIFTLLPIGAGVIMLLISPIVKKWMHGVH